MAPLCASARRPSWMALVSSISCRRRQVNGGGDVLFNDQPSAQAARSIAAAHRRRGTTGLLPTLISDSAEKMRLALQAVNAAVGSEPGILGLHLEGPYLSPEKPGVHDRRQLRQPSPDELAMLTAPRNGVLLVTLAPEIVPTGFIAQLVAAGIRVSLGHSMASYQQTRAAMAEGLTGFTHLFNVMRPLSSREGGPIALALARPPHPRERCDAACRRTSFEFQPARRHRHCPQRLLHEGRRNAGRDGSGHGRSG